MAQFHKVVEAFQATDKETKQPVTDQYGNSKFMFKVENQGPDGWMSVSKKAGTELAVGDYVYGIIDTWPEGKAKFVRQNPPEGTVYPTSERKQDTSNSKPAVQSGSRDEELHEKVDFLIELVEKLLESNGSDRPTRATQGNQGASDDATKPLDLSELPY